MKRWTKRSDTFKRKIVERHLGVGRFADDGPVPLRTLAREFGIERSLIRRWVKSYHADELVRVDPALLREHEEELLALQLREDEKLRIAIMAAEVSERETDRMRRALAEANEERDAAVRRAEAERSACDALRAELRARARENAALTEQQGAVVHVA